MRRHIIALVFRCRSVGGQLAENDETADFRWVTPDNVAGLMSEAYATRILDGLTWTGQPAVRVHDGTSLL